MTKRTSVIAGLDFQKVAAAEAAAEAPPPEAKPKRRARPDIVHTSVYIPKRTYQSLRRIAFDRDCKIHDLFMEGLDEVLKRHGVAGVDRSKRA